MQTKARKAGKSWSSKGAVPRTPSESFPDTNMQIGISSDSKGTTCAVFRYKKGGFLFVTDGRRTKKLKNDERKKNDEKKIICDDVVKFRYVCKDGSGNDICSVSAGTVKTIDLLWKRVLEDKLSPSNISEVARLVLDKLMAVYSEEDFESSETCSIIIAGGIRQEIFHVGGPLADKPHCTLISCAYHVIGSGSLHANASLGIHYSDQDDEETLVRTVEKSYLLASLRDRSTGGFIKFYNVHGETHQHLFTKHTLELYRDLYANDIKPHEVAMLIFSKDFDRKCIQKCFHKKTVLRQAHVLGYVRGYQVNRVVLKREDYEKHLLTFRLTEESLLSSGYVPECRDPVIKSFNSSFYKLSKKHRKGHYYFIEVSRDVLKDVVPQGMVEGLIGRNAKHPGREQSLENVGRRLVVKVGPKESPRPDDVINELLGEEPMSEEVLGDVYDELEISQLEVPARAGKEQPEDSMNPGFDDDITGDSTDDHDICVFCDSGDQGFGICPSYQKSKKSWGPRLKENGGKIRFCDICGKNDYPLGLCPWTRKCHPGAKIEAGAEMICSFCHSYMCFIESQYNNEKPHADGFSRKNCLYCGKSGHLCEVCPSQVKDLVADIELEGSGDGNNGQGGDSEKPNSEVGLSCDSFFEVNLAPQVTEVDLYRHFHDISDVGDGDVTEVMVHNHEDKHYGYLEYRTREAALSAMEKGHHTILCDKKIKCYPTSLVKEDVEIYNFGAAAFPPPP